jgi:hypothetical protein
VPITTVGSALSVGMVGLSIENAVAGTIFSVLLRPEQIV